MTKMLTTVYWKYDDVIFCDSHSLLDSKNTNPAVPVVLITIFIGSNASLSAQKAVS